MKVLYITSSWFVDGDFPLIRQLREKDVDVHLCIKVYTRSLTSTILELKRPYEKTGIFDSSIYGLSIDQYKKYIGVEKIHVINHTHGDNSIKNLSISKEERDLIESFNPDVIHYIGWPSLYEIPLLFRYGKRIVTTVHDPIPHVITKKAKINRIIRKVAYRSIGHYVLLNKNQAKEFANYYGIDECKLLFSRLGNFDVIKAFGSGHQTNTRNILFFGRISPYKGVEYLLESYSSIMNTYPDTKLIVAGGGKYHFDITPYKNNAQIEFINEYISTERLASLIQESEFVVCPYVSATQSGVVASAHALSKPVIATKVGGLPEMIDDGKTGVLVEPQDVSSLTAAIKDFLDNPSKVHTMASNVNRRAIEGPNAWGKIVFDYLEFYKNISGK